MVIRRPLPTARGSTFEKIVQAASFDEPVSARARRQKNKTPGQETHCRSSKGKNETSRKRRDRCKSNGYERRKPAARARRQEKTAARANRHLVFCRFRQQRYALRIVAMPVPCLSAAKVPFSRLGRWAFRGLAAGWPALGSKSKTTSKSKKAGEIGVKSKQTPRFL